MKYTVALLLAASSLPFGTALGASVEDVARNNCIKAILASAAQVTRQDIKTFHFAESGSGYTMSGYDENHRPVSCIAAEDGHVTWINGG